MMIMIMIMMMIMMMIMFMMLETGCSVDEDDMEKICSFLLSASLDTNAVQYNATALRIFQKVCFILIYKAACVSVSESV